jgi:hypothetical protein
MQKSAVTGTAIVEVDAMHSKFFSTYHARRAAKKIILLKSLDDQGRWLRHGFLYTTESGDSVTGQHLQSNLISLPPLVQPEILARDEVAR